MCRADIASDARQPLARVLADMAGALAAQSGVPASDVHIGPVDFGEDDIPCSGSCWADDGDAECPCGVGTEDGTSPRPGWEWTDR